jgi:23S rRNA (cytidine1920-2'-O)/16S rRNA (cytidine1409-2'-O)-methyltransferase
MKRRLDQYLADEGLLESREKAKRAIIAGQIKLNGHRASKPSDIVKDGDHVELVGKDRFVSRGGLKLEHALRHFDLPCQDILAVDLGASTGGFTDCLLQFGAQRVYSVDVGKGQLAWALRQDPRVEVMEQVNARYLKRSEMPADFTGADLVVIDCSFISLKMILPTARELANQGSHIVALIKPQFEAGKTAVDQGRGVIKDPRIHQEVIQSLKTHVVEEMHLDWIQFIESPILGPAGNKEFLCLIKVTDAPNS